MLSQKQKTHTATTLEKTGKIKCANCFKSLGVPARIKIYAFLKEHGETSVSALVYLTDLTQPTVSYHLKEMRMLGLLNARKNGKEVLYRINEDCPESGVECVLGTMKFTSDPDETSKSNEFSKT